MAFPLIDTCCLLAVLVSVLISGTSALRTTSYMFGTLSFLLTIVTVVCSQLRDNPEGQLFAFCFFAIKTIVVPALLIFACCKFNVRNDKPALLSFPLTMYLCVFICAISYLVAGTFPAPKIAGASLTTIAASLSLVSIGLVVMTTRRIALGQVTGFLVLEAGIYLFSWANTRGLPLLVEMGILLDVFAGIMIAGVFLFQIQKNFDHIDSSMLKELRE